MLPVNESPKPPSARVSLSAWRLSRTRAALFMVAGDVMHVAFQERAVLVHVFGDAYRAYQQATPFLVPTPASFAKFVRTVGRRTR